MIPDPAPLRSAAAPVQPDAPSVGRSERAGDPLPHVASLIGVVATHEPGRDDPDQEDSVALCDHCGLPLVPRRPWWGSGQFETEPLASSPVVESAADADAEEDEPDARPARYCCQGCRFAAAVTQSRGEQGVNRFLLVRLGLSGFFAMNVMAFTMALWSFDLYGDNLRNLTESTNLLVSLFRHLTLLFALPVLFLLAPPLVEHAWEELIEGRPSTDLLLASGVLASFGVSIWAVYRDEGPIYFEVGCVVLVFTALGRWFETNGRLKASNALDSLRKLLPPQARKQTEEGGFQEVPTARLQTGDRINVRAGERFPADGIVLRGIAQVDQQILTGESRPITLEPRATALGGTLNLDGDLVLELTSRPGGGAFGKLVEAVRAAGLERGRYQRLADRASVIFVPLVAFLAMGAGVVHGVRSDPETGLMVGLSVVLISCPCALGVAVPMAVWSALGVAARNGVVFRNGEAIERLAKLRAVRFDKTGTLTTGAPEVETVVVEQAKADPAASLAVVAAVTRCLADSSTHAMSRALMDHDELAEAASALPPPRFAPGGEPRNEAGRGVQASLIVNRSPASSSAFPTTVMLGSGRWFDERAWSFPLDLDHARREAETRGRSVSVVGWDGRARGVFVFRERLRPETVGAIAECERLGLDVAVLTGDHPTRGRALAEELGVRVEAGLLPDQKREALRVAEATIGPTAMVGDGINDAPALAASSCGVAMGCGADVARDSALVCLVGDDVGRVPWSFCLARATVATARLNLVWAFGYNFIGVGVAVLGLLNPAFAAVLMVGSSLFVISNSLRLASWRAPGELAEPTPTESFVASNPALGQPASARRDRGGTEARPVVESPLISLNEDGTS